MYLTFQRCRVFMSLVSLRLSKDTIQRKTPKDGPAVFLMKSRSLKTISALSVALCELCRWRLWEWLPHVILPHFSVTLTQTRPCEPPPNNESTFCLISDASSCFSVAFLVSELNTQNLM